MEHRAPEEQEQERERAVGNAWRIARWLMTAVGMFVLLTLFVSQSTTAEAAAPTATSGNDVVYSTFACDASNNYCFTTQYNLNYNYGCGVGGFNCGAFNTGVVYNPGLYGGVPNAVFTNNGCPVGNYACLGTFPFVGGPNFVVANNCPSGNFSCFGTAPFFGGPSYVFANNGCALGNFSCFGTYPFFGNSFFFGSTGVFSGNTTVVAPSGNRLNVGPPFRVKEAAPVTAATSSAPQAAAPVAAPAQIAAPAAAPVQVAAPIVEAAPAAPANFATALNAPAAVPAAAPASTSGVKILSAPTATTPAVESTGRDSRD